MKETKEEYIELLKSKTYTEIYHHIKSIEDERDKMKEHFNTIAEKSIELCCKITALEMQNKELIKRLGI